MLKNIVSIEEFRVNLADLIGRVMYGKDRIIIKKYNKDAAILLNMEDYERLIDPTKRFTKDEWNKKFAVIDKIRERIPEYDQELLEQELGEAVREVRAEKKKDYEQNA